MDQPQSSQIRPTILNRRKKTTLKPPNIPIIREIQDRPVASHEIENIDIKDSEEVILPMEGSVDLTILKSFETNVAYFVSKNGVNKHIFG